MLLFPVNSDKVKSFMAKVENNLTEQNKQKLIKYNIIPQDGVLNKDLSDNSDTLDKPFTHKKRTFMSLSESKTLRKRSFQATELS